MEAGSIDGGGALERPSDLCLEVEALLCVAEEEEEDAIPICGFRRGGRRRRWKKKNLSCGFLLAQRKKRGRGRRTRAYSIPSISWWNQITTIYPLFYSFGN
ncbi:hypothetical protein LXL04_010107 [Taraxacum kok-saghyz]